MPNLPHSLAPGRALFKMCGVAKAAEVEESPPEQAHLACCALGQAAKDYRTDADLHAACEPDAKQLCAGATSGEGRVQDCLRDKAVSVSWECQEELFRQVCEGGGPRLASSGSAPFSLPIRHCRAAAERMWQLRGSMLYLCTLASSPRLSRGLQQWAIHLSILGATFGCNIFL